MDSRNCSLEIPQRRDVTLDIAKALCIILMVVGHSGCPDYLHRFIYMFHMPCFFFISGWLLSDKYATDLKTGLLKKVKGYYKPFIKWELIFLLCHNLFAWLHIYNDSYPLRDIPLKAVRIFTMTGGEQLLGGFWFLISIFWASVAALLFVALLHRRKCLTIFNIWGGVILTLLLAMTEEYIPIELPVQFGSKTILATAFYMTGYACKRMKLNFDKSPLIGLFLLALPAIAALFTTLSMSTTGTKIMVFYPHALSGAMGTLILSSWLSRQTAVRNQLLKIGRKTLYILTFHFLAFKLVSYVYIQLVGRPIVELVQFPVLQDTTNWLWVIYTIIGIGVPVGIWEVVNRISVEGKVLVRS